MNARCLRATKHCAQVVRVLNSIQDDDEWGLIAASRAREHLFQLGVALPGHQRDDPLVFSPGDEPVEHRLRLTMNRDPCHASQPDEGRKLTILAHHKQPRQGPIAAAERFPNGVQPVQDFRSLIASSGWCHPADPQS